MSLPTHRRTFKTHTPEKVVYLIKKDNGEIDVQYADTEDVKKSLLANARQNGASEKMLREINKEKLYEILENEKWLDYVIEKTYGNNTYKTPLFSPAYTSVISQGNMIERKLRNHATRKYPKNFDSKAISELYEQTFEDIKEVEVITAEEKLKISEEEFDNKSGQDHIEDDRPQLEVVEEKPEKEIPKHNAETGEIIEEEVEEPKTEKPHVEEKKIVVETKQEENDDDPQGWDD
jgi:hypothetical protein